MPGAGRDPQPRTTRSSSRCGRSAWSTRCSTRASTSCRRWSGAAPTWSPTACGSRPTSRSPAASTTTPAPSSRPGWTGYESLGSICSGGRYDALASDGRKTYPGVGISLGVSRVLVPLLDKGVLVADRSGAQRRPGRARRRGVAPAASDAVAAALRAPRHTVRGRRHCAEVRQADPLRRASRHPVRLVPRRSRAHR